MHARFTLGLLLVACGGSKGSAPVEPSTSSDTDTDTDTDTDADTDTDTDADTDTDTASAVATADTATTAAPAGLFLEATGTVDGVTTTFSCREGDPGYAFYATQLTDGSGTYVLGGACNLSDSTRTLSINIGVTASGPASEPCQPGGFGIQVLDLFGGTAYNCALNGGDPFLLEVDEFVVEGDGSVVWGGAFEVRGSGTMAVDLAGTYRFRSSP